MLVSVICRLRAVHNPARLCLAPSYAAQEVSGVIRTHSFCELKGEMPIPKCNTFIGCFESYDNLYDWANCMENTVQTLRIVCVCVFWHSTWNRKSDNKQFVFRTNVTWMMEK